MKRLTRIQTRPQVESSTTVILRATNDHFIEIPIADLPSPPTSWLPASDMNMYGARPLLPEIAIVTCTNCNKPVQESALAEHASTSYTSAQSRRLTSLSLSLWVRLLVNCEKIRNGGGESLLSEGGKKRKAEELLGEGSLDASASGGGVLGSAIGSGGSGGPAKKKKKTTVKAGKTGKARVKRMSFFVPSIAHSWYLHTS